MLKCSYLCCNVLVNEMAELATVTCRFGGTCHLVCSFNDWSSQWCRDLFHRDRKADGQRRTH